MNKINLPESIKKSVKGKESKYTLVNGGSNVMVKIGKDGYEMYGVQNMSPFGVLCDDLETFIKWEDFQ